MCPDLGDYLCRYAELEAAKNAMEKEYRQMLSMYDDEFEDGTEALKELAKQVKQLVNSMLFM